MTLIATSTANDQLSAFGASLGQFTLTSESGQTVSLLAANQNVEFMHLNGTFETLATVSVPQGVYTSASANIQAGMLCVGQGPSSTLWFNGSNPYGDSAIPSVTVRVPSPIRITGTAMGLVLNLQVPKLGSNSANCYSGSAPTPTVSAAIDVTPLAFTSLAANPITERGLQGRITGLNLQNNTLAVTLTDGQSLSLTANENTIYQGISGFSALATGMMANLVAQINSDGSLQVTRMAVEDLNTVNLTVASGPITSVSSAIPVFLELEQQGEGSLLAAPSEYYSFPTAAFQIAGPANVEDLPFPAMFDSSNIFSGEATYVTTNATTVMPEPTYVVASSVTLIAQTIDGVVTSTGSEGNFTTYTISLAPYDLVPNLAVQPGQTTALANPSSVVVYVDSNTQLTNSQPVNVGVTYRFHGLLFDDSGTARLDCDQISDGVPQ